MDRGAWQVTVHGVTKQLDIVTKTKQTNKKKMDAIGYIQSPAEKTDHVNDKF